jgi:hypothetical protein
MSRRLWYRDSYGRWHEDSHAEDRSGMPGEMGSDHTYGVRWLCRNYVNDPLRTYVGWPRLLDYL